jgi:glycerophosphoryl diester phosphodiesterase
LITRPPLDAWLHGAGTLSAVCPDASLVTEQVVAALRDAGLDCYVLADETAQPDWLVAWGVSGIITDRPGLLRTRLGW